MSPDAGSIPAASILGPRDTFLREIVESRKKL